MTLALSGQLTASEMPLPPLTDPLDCCVRPTDTIETLATMKLSAINHLSFPRA
jgi:hypothetical protein